MSSFLIWWLWLQVRETPGQVVLNLLPFQSGFQCPNCKKSYGVKTGDMPSGTMTVTTRRSSLPGHEGYNTIEIVYNFRAGVHVSLCSGHVIFM